MAGRIPRSRGEVAVAVSLLLVAGYVGREAWRMPEGSVALPGPGLFPLALAGLLAGSALGLLIRAARAGGPREAVGLGHRNILVVLGGLVGLALLLERAGFLLAMGAFLSVLFKTLSGRGWPRSVAVAVVTAVATWLVFGRVLGVALPAGRWW